MTDRERRLGLFFGGALVIVLVMVGYKWLQDNTKALNKEVKDLKSKIEVMDFTLESAAGAERFSEFLERYEPKESRLPQDVQTELLTFSRERVRLNQLTEIKSPAVGNPEPGDEYSRVRVSLTLRGTEKSMLSFLTQIADPKVFRNVSRLMMEPRKDDETNTEVDAVVEIDQWFIPKSDSEREADIESVGEAEKREAQPVKPPRGGPPAKPTPNPTPPAPPSPGGGQLPPGLNPDSLKK